jgi:hypothetical protein
MLWLESREYCRRDPLLWPLDRLYRQTLVLTSPTSGGRSVGIVRSRTQAIKFFFCGCSLAYWKDWIKASKLLIRLIGNPVLRVWCPEHGVAEGLCACCKCGQWTPGTTLRERIFSNLEETRKTWGGHVTTPARSLPLVETTRLAGTVLRIKCMFYFSLELFGSKCFYSSKCQVCHTRDAHISACWHSRKLSTSPLFL